MDYNNVEIIGIDHGWSMMKTVSYVFTAGVGEIKTEPAIYENLLEYEGRYFRVGGERLTVKPTKITDENYYILTLAAVAKELERRGKRSANLYLAVGLPLTRFGAEKQEFIDYLSKREVVHFKYEQKTYDIKIVKVSVFPQCYSAVVDRIPAYTKKVLIVDIGSWTLDIMPIINKSPDESQCITAPQGLISCMREINKQCVRMFGGEIDESEIQQVMRYGSSDIDAKYLDVIKSNLVNFSNEVYNRIGEHGFNLATTQVVFVGGGASVMRLFGKVNDRRIISYIEDVKANAKGYETLARIAVKAKGRVG